MGTGIGDRGSERGEGRFLAAVRRIIGVPDYDAYVAHLRAHHPEQTPPSRDAFLRQCWEEKYSRPGHRCC